MSIHTPPICVLHLTPCSECMCWCISLCADKEEAVWNGMEHPLLAGRGDQPGTYVEECLIEEFTCSFQRSTRVHYTPVIHTVHTTSVQNKYTFSSIIMFPVIVMCYILHGTCGIECLCYSSALLQLAG